MKSPVSLYTIKRRSNCHGLLAFPPAGGPRAPPLISHPRSASGRLSMSTSVRALATVRNRRLLHRRNFNRLDNRHQRRRLVLEGLEPRNLLATLFVDNPGDFTPANPNPNDTVTWNPGPGSQHGGAVSGLVFGTNAF